MITVHKNDGNEPVSPSNNLPTDYQNFIAISRYARFDETKGRRETWNETVERYFNFFDGYIKENNPKGYTAYSKIRKELETAVLELKVLPSMRCLMTAGKALERDMAAGYNCSFIAVDTPRAFDEAMYILMCGTGVGFSVENQHVSKLPVISEEFQDTETTVSVPDSKLGWAVSFRELIAMLYAGRIPKWDMSKLRPAGAKLKTMGGRSSGPEPLDSLFRFAVATFRNAAGRKLTSIEAHDLMCKIGDIVVVGGVRRSALLSLSDLGDEKMRNAKSGKWWEHAPQRALANNSVAYQGKPDMETFLREWLALVESKSGERGVFNIGAAQKHAASNGRRDGKQVLGTNPCSEILLRANQFCNLSEVVVRDGDSVKVLENKVRLAAIIGTLQATLTNFRYLRKNWKTNTEEEALLGVSLTGIMDHEILGHNNDKLSSILKNLKEVAVETNKEWAKILGINQAAAVTCVKPSGTVSQLADSSSGIHARHSRYYIRTVRGDKKDPLVKLMTDLGFPSADDVTKPNHTTVFSFPMKSPEHARLRDELSAIEQLEVWKTYATSWCEHKPSVTITCREHEWLEVGAWVYKNFDIMSGVSFLPHTDHVYQQAPYQEATKDQYEALLAKMPQNVDWSALSKYESEDNTSGTQTLACSGGSCELVDLSSTPAKV